jgi:HlyD family secretion protein
LGERKPEIFLTDNQAIKMIKKIGSFIMKRKLIFCVVLIILAVSGYYGYKHFFGGNSQTRYVLAAVEKGSLITSVSGSGQVSSSDQVEVKAKASGSIVYLGMEKGQEIKKSDLLVKIDTTNALEAIETAQNNLDTLQVELDKMKGTTTAGITIKSTKEKAIDTLQRAYESGFDSLTSIYYNLSTMMSGLETLVLGNNFDFIQTNIYYYGNSINKYDSKSMAYEQDAYAKYLTAVSSYKKSLEDYKSTNKFSSQMEINSLIDGTYETVKNINIAMKSINDLIDFYQDILLERDITPETISTTHMTTLNTYSGTINGYLTTLLTTKDGIQTKAEAVIDADYDVADKELQVKNAKEALKEAKDNLEDYYVYAPFDGVVAEVNVESGDSLSEDAVSANTAIATFITKENMAEVSLNEVDAANVKVGQSVILTFDAISDLTLTGKVYDIDTIGTVSQGVVSYNVKISFDTQSDQVKPGMTISVSIIAEVKQDVLLVSNSAVKEQNGLSYVQVPNSLDANLSTTSNSSGVILNNPLEAKQIEVGSSNEDYTEVTSGLAEGDIVVLKTTTGSKTTTTSKTTTSGIQGGNMGPGIGGGIF